LMKHGGPVKERKKLILWPQALLKERIPMNVLWTCDKLLSEKSEKL
jgi:hypothetical protein